MNTNAKIDKLSTGYHNNIDFGENWPYDFGNTLSPWTCDQNEPAWAWEVVLFETPRATFRVRSRRTAAATCSAKTMPGRRYASSNNTRQQVHIHLQVFFDRGAIHGIPLCQLSSKIVFKYTPLSDRQLSAGRWSLKLWARVCSLNVACGSFPLSPVRSGKATERKRRREQYMRQQVHWRNLGSKGTKQLDSGILLWH